MSLGNADDHPAAYGGTPPREGNESAVLNFLKNNPAASNVDVAEAIGKSVSTAQTALRSLKGKGLLTREGARGRWMVKQPDPEK
jgi:predicted HTH transcriptional regulator